MNIARVTAGGVTLGRRYCGGILLLASWLDVEEGQSEGMILPLFWVGPDLKVIALQTSYRHSIATSHEALETSLLKQPSECDPQYTEQADESRLSNATTKKLCIAE